MAKSLRSKWKRKCRAVKRVRYGEKELVRLKKTLGIDETQTVKSDVIMEEIGKVATVVNAKAIQEKTEAEKNENIEKNETVEKEEDKEGVAEKVEGVEMETDKVKRVYDPVTKRDQFGNKPVWMLSKKKKKSKRLNHQRKGKKGRRH